ncbi:hypothetical protein VIN01S_28100 [Vibrio inusitatus NBRC 102082]|uniref:Uncharacterized protein n=1 Tax=Vibrio inusitatus NBRC 102082 TaxID=1219070 RepID=A0A4Y3HXZ6_9VIBR|nr:hypothetical protein VIN01S_28100 [Vibrio inusitatus NBRC 102082]
MGYSKIDHSDVAVVLRDEVSYSVGKRLLNCETDINHYEYVALGQVKKHGVEHS